MKRTLLLLGFALSLMTAFSQKADPLASAVNQIHLDFIEADNSDKGISETKLSELKDLYDQSLKAGYQVGIELCGTDLIRQYIRHGNYQKVVEIGGQIIGSSKSYSNSTTATETHRMMGLAYSNLGLYDKSLEEYHLSIDAVSQVKTADFRHYLRAIAYENITSYFEFTRQHLDSIEYYYRKSIEEAKLISDTGSRIPSNYKFNAILYPHKDLADYYLNICKPPQPHKAQQEIEIALKMNESGHGKVMISNKIAFLNTLCQCLYSQKAYQKTIRFGMQGLELESTAPSPYDRADIYEVLAKSYLAQNDKDASGKYMNLYTLLKDSLQASEKIQTSTAVTQLLDSQRKTHASNARQIILWALGVILSIILLVYIIWKTDSKSLHKKYEYLVRQLQEEKQQQAQLALIAASTVPESEGAATQIQNEIDTETNADTATTPVDMQASIAANEEKPGSSGISDETLSRLLVKLEKFERSHKYLKPEINLAFLSHYLGTNQTYLTELLKVHRGMTYRNYMNGLKIDYIKKKLYEEPIYREYKITHLAEECGFASRQVFISVFKKQTGMPPSFFINQLKQERHLRQEQIVSSAQ